MNVNLRHRFRRAGDRKAVRFAAALGLISTMLVLAGSGPVFALTGFVNPPERLYMLPKSPIPLIPQAALGFLVPNTSMLFIGPDLISMDGREIVLDFVDSPVATPCKANVDAPVGQADYDITNCTRIKMQVTHGRLSVGPLTQRFKDDASGIDDPASPVYLTPSGAQVDLSSVSEYNAENGVKILSLNGTKLQLNNALQLLTYTPNPDENDDGNTTTNDFYRYDGFNPETLDLSLTIDETVDPPDSTLEWDVDIRVLDINDWPELDGANDFGDGAGDGPVAQTADPGIEKIIPGMYSLTDIDNDEIVDGDGSDDPDRNDGAGNDMMLIGYLDCDTDPAPLSDTGFHFSSATYESGVTTIDSALNFMLGLGNPPVPPAVPPADQAEADGFAQKLLVKSAFLTALAATPIGSNTMLTSAGPVDYGTFFVGVTEIDEVQAAIENIYFEHDIESDSCEMLVIVSDLGNNGLPLQYVSNPDFRQYGVEFPAFGFDWDQFTITTGELQEIDVSFDSSTLYVNEGDTATAPVRVTPPPPIAPDPERPLFSFRWAAVDGTAIAGTHYQGTSNNNPVVGSADLEVLVETSIFPDVVGNRAFTFELEVPSDLPPGEIDEPDGYRIVSAVPTRQVVIIDDDDDAKSITSVSGAMVPEGDTGTTNLTFTIGLDGPADGNESVTVDASSVGASVEGTDYETFDPQVVTFAPGATSATVDVVVNGDTEIELDEIITLNLSLPVDVGLTTVSGSGTIENDDAAPTVTIDQGVTQSDPTNVSPIVFDVVFDKPVTGFDSGALDVNLSGTAGGTLVATIAPVGVSTTRYTVSVTGMTTSGNVVATIPADAAQDAVLRNNEPSTSDDNSVTWDVTAPTVTIDQGSTQNDPTSMSPIVFDVVFSEPVTGFNSGDVTFVSTAGTPLTATVAGSGTTYTVSVTGMTQDGTVTATLAAGIATDAATNPNTASTSTDNTVTFDFDEDAPDPLTITLPADIVVQVSNGTTGANVNYPTPTTTGGTPPVTVVCNPASGAFYPLGTTPVTCTATDSEQILLLASRQITSLFTAPKPKFSALTATATFNVTVVELPAVTIAVPAPTIPIIPAPTIPIIPVSTIDFRVIPPGPIVPPGGSLPETGSNSTDLVAIAAGVVALGCLLLTARRQNPSTSRARPARRNSPTLRP